MSPEEFVHYEDPFRTPRDQEDPLLRFRGALAKGVTIWTAGEGDARAGLTVSSLLVAEGDPSHVLGLINDTTDLYGAILESGRFIVHVLSPSDQILGEVFAGTRPAPGGTFEGLDSTQTEWGPEITRLLPRACCTFVDTAQPGYQKLVRGRIDKIEMGEGTEPLVHFRGRYRTFGAS
jgi:flavin reductase (DIM6/NTAB) family NADH-FMN oxidoreductase RutF